MTDKDLSKDLWQVANILTGFAVVQAIAFIYACAKQDFAMLINTFPVKMTIAIHIIIVTVAECYAVWWCADKAVALLANGRQTEDTEDINRNMINSITKRVAWGRIVIILSLLLPALLSLYARQLGGMPFNGKVPNQSLQQTANRVH